MTPVDHRLLISNDLPGAQTIMLQLRVDEIQQEAIVTDSCQGHLLKRQDG